MTTRGKNPETIITEQIRNILRLLKIPHHKNFGGPMGEKGVTDIVGCLPPHGRALYLEVKTETGKLSEQQATFMRARADAGALTFVARSAQDVVRVLKEAGYEPALQLWDRQ